eukprot:CAMPEP_0204308126 /NCGR_PEP_ID=MMETSP0469-20131031/316_1 /ASSEMBLY_ACC=CAM_ASM_000384 /TAXON_ID=2969 /ORGANISM="Oxyrrhis marina" /LENGTH=407 /DNA_ID=CAMNT_0051287551 /DNA_START=11 /DNA_END=1230 /DNA_ORIENTATION=+
MGDANPVGDPPVAKAPDDDLLADDGEDHEATKAAVRQQEPQAPEANGSAIPDAESGTMAPEQPEAVNSDAPAPAPAEQTEAETQATEAVPAAEEPVPSLEAPTSEDAPAVEPAPVAEAAPLDTHSNEAGLERLERNSTMVNNMRRVDKTGGIEKKEVRKGKGKGKGRKGKGGEEMEPSWRQKAWIDFQRYGAKRQYTEEENALLNCGCYFEEDGTLIVKLHDVEIVKVNKVGNVILTVGGSRNEQTRTTMCEALRPLGLCVKKDWENSEAWMVTDGNMFYQSFTETTTVEAAPEVRKIKGPHTGMMVHQHMTLEILSVKVPPTQAASIAGSDVETAVDEGSPWPSTSAAAWCGTPRPGHAPASLLGCACGSHAAPHAPPPHVIPRTSTKRISPKMVDRSSASIFARV